MAEEAIQNDMDTEEVELDQYVVFAVKSQEFAFQAIRVREIVSVLEPTQVPNAPPYVDGIVNLRGQLATVINFRNKFGFEAKEHDEDTRTIVVEQDDFPIGILVDSVEEVIKIPDTEVQKLPESTSTSVSEEYITGVGLMENRLIILLNVDKVLTKSELVEIEEVRQAINDAQDLKTEEETEMNQKEDVEPGI